jgi:hypothetical protein
MFRVLVQRAYTSIHRLSHRITVANVIERTGVGMFRTSIPMYDPANECGFILVRLPLV